MAKFDNYPSSYSAWKDPFFVIGMILITLTVMFLWVCLIASAQPDRKFLFIEIPKTETEILEKECKKYDDKLIEETPYKCIKILK